MVQFPFTKREKQIFALIAIGIAVFAAYYVSRDTTQLPSNQLIIHTRHGPVQYEVEVANSRKELANGLMFRDSLAPNTGMIFDFGRTRDITMWMKNTLISLDMLFINEDGIIVTIAPNTTPYSLTPIQSGLPAMSVLEINGGEAYRNGIQLGDKVEHRIFGHSNLFSFLP